MLPTPARALALLVLFGAPARAHSVGDELSVSGTQAHGASPASVNVTDKLSGVFDLRSVQLRADFSYTRLQLLSAAAGASFADSPADVFRLSLGADWQATRHFDFGIEANYSPPSTSTSDSPLTATTRSGSVSVDGELSSQLSTVGGSVWAGFDTASASRYQTYVDVAFAATGYLLDEHVDAVWSKRLDRTVAPSLPAAQSSLFQGRLSASVTETLGEHWDLRLDGAYYLYDRDPTQVGYAAASGGRLAGREVQFGNGLAIAPWQFTAQPSVTAFVHGLSATLSFQYGQYVSDGDFSYDLTAGLRLDYRVGTRTRLWLKANGQRDVDASGLVSYGGSGALGVKVSF